MILTQAHWNPRELKPSALPVSRRPCGGGSSSRGSGEISCPNPIPNSPPSPPSTAAHRYCAYSGGSLAGPVHPSFHRSPSLPTPTPVDVVARTSARPRAGVSGALHLRVKNQEAKQYSVEGLSHQILGHMDSSNGRRKSRSYLTWTDNMDRALLNVLAEHHNNGNHTANGWKPPAYSAVVKVVREKCGVEITKDHVCSRCKTFDKHCSIISKLLSRSDFGWDRDKNMLIIHNEDAWKVYIEKNKAAACYRNKVIKNWDSISLIFSRDYATSEDESVGTENAQEMALKGAEDVREPTQNSHSTSGPSSQDHGGTPESTRPSRQCRRSKRFRTDDALFCMSGNIKNSFQISMKPNEPFEERTNASPKEIFAALQEIPNLGRGDLLRAYCILTSNDRKFESLVALPMDMRKDWLMMELSKK